MAIQSLLPPKTSSNESLRTWRSIAQEITTEQDPKRFAELTKELLKTIDEQELSLRQKKRSA